VVTVDPTLANLSMRRRVTHPAFAFADIIAGKVRASLSATSTSVVIVDRRDRTREEVEEEVVMVATATAACAITDDEGAPMTPL